MCVCVYRLHDNKLHGVEVQAGDVEISDCDISMNAGHDIYISETNGECKFRISKTNAESYSAVDDLPPRRGDVLQDDSDED
jgi:hypothetical protein